MPIAEFAALIGIARNTAKRWLCSSFANQYVSVRKGSRWSVLLPEGHKSLHLCRLARAIDQLIQRKSVASKDLPAFRLSDPKSCSGVDRLWLRGDAIALHKQLDEEANQGLSFNLEGNAEQCAALMLLLRASFTLQKEGRKLTAGNIAEKLGMSLASVYRAPFGRRLMRAVFARVSLQQAYGRVDAERNAAAEGLHQREPREKIPYDKRKGAFVRRKIARDRHFLCWIKFGDSSALWLIPEQEIIQNGQAPRPESGHTFPVYRAADFRKVSRWLSSKPRTTSLEGEGFQGDPPGTFRTPIGGFVRDVDTWRWNCEFGGRDQGDAVSEEDAESEILKRVYPGATRRRVIILNKRHKGRWDIPVCQFKFSKPTC